MREGGETMTQGERAALPGRKTRVLIVDDHALVRAGFKQLLDTTDDLEAAGEAGTAAAALSLAATGRFDIVLLDISLPDANVLETVSSLRRKQPELPILIVSMYPEEQYAVNLLRAGVSGFFPEGRRSEGHAAGTAHDRERQEVHQRLAGRGARDGGGGRCRRAAPPAVVQP